MNLYSACSRRTACGGMRRLEMDRPVARVRAERNRAAATSARCLQPPKPPDSWSISCAIFFSAAAVGRKNAVVGVAEWVRLWLLSLLSLLLLSLLSRPSLLLLCGGVLCDCTLFSSAFVAGESTAAVAAKSVRASSSSKSKNSSIGLSLVGGGAVQSEEPFQRDVGAQSNLLALRLTLRRGPLIERLRDDDSLYSSSSSSNAPSSSVSRS